MDRQAQFRAREAQIFEVAEQLLLENGESGMTLDALAMALDLAKGTLYKHFGITAEAIVSAVESA